MGTVSVCRGRRAKDGVIDLTGGGSEREDSAATLLLAPLVLPSPGRRRDGSSISTLQRESVSKWKEGRGCEI